MDAYDVINFDTPHNVLRSWCPSPNARKLGPVFARRSFLLGAVVAAAVVVPVAAWCAVCAITACADAGGPLGADGLFVGCGDDFNG
jgi:hypothetical protein